MLNGFKQGLNRMQTRQPCMMTPWVPPSYLETEKPSPDSLQYPGVLFTEWVWWRFKDTQTSVFSLSIFHGPHSRRWGVVSAVRSYWRVKQPHKILIDPTVWISSWKTSQYVSSREAQNKHQKQLRYNRPTIIPSSSAVIITQAVSWLCLFDLPTVSQCSSTFISDKGALMKGSPG